MGRYRHRRVHPRPRVPRSRVLPRAAQVLAGERVFTRFTGFHATCPSAPHCDQASRTVTQVGARCSGVGTCARSPTPALVLRCLRPIATAVVLLRVSHHSLPSETMSSLTRGAVRQPPRRSNPAQCSSPASRGHDAVDALYDVLADRKAPHAAKVSAARALLEQEDDGYELPRTVRQIQQMSTADLHRLVRRLEAERHSLPVPEE